MGGATLGFALARAGRRVLFVEKGLNLHLPGADRIDGRFVEDRPDFLALQSSQQARQLAQGGRASDDVRDLTRPLYRTTFTPYIGSGTGGSSALYGMVLERMFPIDFETWPIGYDDLRPWYEAVERLYRVRGGPDPLRPSEAGAVLTAPPLSSAGAAIAETLTRRGVHPYRLHVACESRPGCQTCQGYLCGEDCKNDAGRICLAPAVTDHGASLLTECTALALGADRERVQTLECSWRGQPLTLRSTLFVLAAGALATPALLLQSASQDWPTGLANDSGLVGRHLMRHAIDLFVLTGAPTVSDDAPVKELGFNDFYAPDSGKFGTVQSFGRAMPLGYLQNRQGLNGWRLLGRFAPWFWEHYARFPILGAILEDSPSADNYVGVDHAAHQGKRVGVSVQYCLDPADVVRRRRFRRLVEQVLAPLAPRRVRGTTDRHGLGHVCGTCRFGADHRTSVLDRWNRAHGLSNLYVVDGSFFPTSGGTNPALTIAANALRVACHLSSTSDLARRPSGSS